MAAALAAYTAVSSSIPATTKISPGRNLFLTSLLERAMQTFPDTAL